MERSLQSDREIYRVIVLGQAGTELLLAPTATGVSLPEVEVPRWQRAAANLNAAMKSRWGEEVICLFTPDVGPSPGTEREVHYQMAEHWREVGKSDSPTQWVPTSTLSEASFAHPADYAAVRRALAEHDAHASGTLLVPFGSVGWVKQLIEWMREVIEPKGFHLTGNFCQVNAGPSFSLIRFETDDTAVWFKAVGEPNLREFPITLTLAQLFPVYLPTILATRPAWNGWLSSEVEGTNLSETLGTTLWKAAAVGLARLQIESVGHDQRLLDAGARNLGVGSLSDMVQPFFDVMGQLMDRQTKIPPPLLSRKELASLGKRIQDALCLFAEFGIPDTLGHLDLNSGNIFVSANRCAFLDWAEAYAGPPFLSFEYLLEHFRRAVGADNGLDRQLITSYAEQWGQVVSAAAITEALAVAPLLAVFAYAAATGPWRHEHRLRDPETAGYLRALTRRMNREASRLSDRRSRCPN